MSLETNTAGVNEQAWGGIFPPPPPQHTCPNCGYCPHCGRGGYNYPYYPHYPNPIYTVNIRRQYQYG